MQIYYLVIDMNIFKSFEIILLKKSNIKLITQIFIPFLQQNQTSKIIQDHSFPFSAFLFLDSISFPRSEPNGPKCNYILSREWDMRFGGFFN